VLKAAKRLILKHFGLGIGILMHIPGLISIYSKKSSKLEIEKNQSDCGKSKFTQKDNIPASISGAKRPVENSSTGLSIYVFSVGIGS
jgi:hypothetical protein